MTAGEGTAPALQTLQAWLDTGQALRVHPWLDGLLADGRLDAQLLAVRALRQLGADRASDALSLRLARRHPAQAEAQLGALRAVLGNRGAYAGWRALQRLPLAADADAPARAGRLSLEGLWLAGLRDDTQALDCQRRALELEPADPWLWVEHSYALMAMDRAGQALEAARQALALQPGYRTALLQVARLLAQLQRRDEARALLEPALQATAGASFAWQLQGLADDDQRHDEALALLDRVEQGLPRADRSWTGQLAARRADTLLHLGRLDAAREQAARVPGTGFYARLAQRLAAGPDGTTPAPRRVLLPLAMAQQHWMTCAPATLAALAGYWGRAADHLEVAQAICYDGTPQASERAWAQSQGFLVRECKLDAPTACALIDAGVPFALATQHVGGGHLQAVVGYDALRGTLLVRDPSQPLHAEYEATQLFDAQQAAGPRALLMLPPQEQARLQGIELPQAAAWDLGHEVLAALQRHDRDAALAALQRLRELEPGGDTALRAERHLAIYDGDEPRILAATEALLQRYPGDRNLQLSRLSSLFEVHGQAAGEAGLAQLVAQPQPDPLLLARWAGQLAQDGSRLGQAMAVTRRALRRDGRCARAWSELGDELWAQYGGAEGARRALQPARWASTLQPTDEGVAAAYARACRVAGVPEQGLAWLRERDRVWGDRSGQPALTLAEELDAQQRDAEAQTVLDAALERRPADTPLRLRLAERRLCEQRLGEAEQLLQACTDAHVPALLRLRALLHEERGDLDAALAAVREAVALEPLQLSHHRLLLRLLRRLHGDAQALAEWRVLADARAAHFGLHKLLYEALPDDAQAINAQLAHLHAHHPGVAWLQRERAVQAARQGRLDEAVELANAAAVLAPAAAVSHDVLAYCQQRRDGYVAARPHLHAALRLDAEYEPALQRLLDAPDAAAQREATDFVATELRRQVLLGDGLLSFQAAAGRAWAAAEVLALLRELGLRWPALWQGPVAEARQLVLMQQPEQALTVLAAAAQRFPALPRVHLEQAEALRQAGRIDEALQANGRALALSPGWNRAVRLQVDLLCDHGRRWAEAEQVLQHALHGRDAWCDADLVGLLAWVQDGQGRDADALAQARRALLLDPQPDWVWNLARRLCDRAEAPQRFDELIDAVVASRPGDASAWLVRAERGRDDVQALAAAERAIALQAQHEAAWQARFERLRRLGRTDEIEQLLQALPWPAPAPVALRAWQARALWARGDHEAAIAALGRLCEEAPHDEALCVCLADWLDERDHHAAYLRQALALVAIAPLKARSQGYLGHARLKNGQAAEALQPLQRALELAPGYTFAARQLARAAREAGQPALAEPALQALWPHQADVATACDGIELAVAAREPERARAWLDRLFALDEFDIDRCQAALKAWREAGWGASLLPLQRAQVARGGGPMGVATDWLLQREPRGFLRTCVEAMQMQRGAQGPHLLLALMRWLAARRARFMLGLLLRWQDARLRADPTTWGEASYALSRLDEHRAVVRWLHDWRTRERPPPYAMANLAGSLAVLRRWAELDAVVQATLARLPYQEDMRLWQLLLLARARRIDALDEALARSHEWRPDPWMQRPLQALQAFVGLARERAGGDSVRRLRQLGCVDGPDQARVLHRELRRLAVWRHTPWTRLPRWL